MTGIKEARGMTDELMEQRIAELNARNTEKAPTFDSEKRAYSVDDIMEILDISRSSAYTQTPAERVQSGSKVGADGKESRSECHRSQSREA